jgi:hypothetical protein
VVNLGRIGRSREGDAPRRYVASLLWPGRLPRPANDNRRTLGANRLLSLVASAALLAAAVWAVVC